MFDSTIRSGAVIDRAILDKQVRRRARVRSSGTAPTSTPRTSMEPGRLNTGITVVGKRAVVPRGIRIGRNVRIDGDVRVSDFAGSIVRSGCVVERRVAAGAPGHGRGARGGQLSRARESVICN